MSKNASEKPPSTGSSYADYANWRNKSVSWLRDALGGSAVKETELRAVEALAKAHIPHLVIGGLAVGEHGYVYATADVDIVVLDVDAAVNYLATHGFTESLGPGGFRWTHIKVIMTDNQTGVDIELMPAGAKVGAGQLALPTPTAVNNKPQYVDAVTLINLKLDAYLHDRILRSKDHAAVVELVKTGKFPKDLRVHESVRQEYLRIWEAINPDQQQ